MKIAYLHYHLKPGGVTSVIRQQIDALKNIHEILVISSGTPQVDCSCDVKLIPGLSYDTPGKNHVSPSDLADQILYTITKTWPGGCDLIHVHNPTLAKNSSLIEALSILRDRGIKLFLQIHDLAEDGRPNAYYTKPYVADVHYGVINSRDYSILVKAGLNKKGLHLIPNQVIPFPSGEISGHGFILYPVRAIRRKNTGEAILLSLYSGEKHPVGITLPPNSPWEKILHQGWRLFTRENKLPVHLDIGLLKNYADLVYSAYFIITTSINEGFGFAFLEPWTANKYVFGRRIDHVCKDFEHNGMIFEDLYNRLSVPTDYFDLRDFYLRRKKSILKYNKDLGFPIRKEVLEKSAIPVTENSSIDFGALDEKAQQQVILSLIKSGKKKASVTDMNPWLENIGVHTEDYDIIEKNRERVLKFYGQEKYRNNLLSIYNSVLNVNVNHSIDKLTLLKKFFNPETFYPLRWPNV